MSCRFLYLSDTHWQAGQMAFHQQPEYSGKLPELLSLLDEWIRRDAAIDFVLHGGDMVNAATEASIRSVVEQVKLSVPLYLCLGNHDLTQSDALPNWLSMAPDWFPCGDPSYTMRLPGCRLHVVPNQWNARPFLWVESEGQAPHFLPEQRARLEAWLCEDTHLPHILSTHAPARAVSEAQTGMTAPLHPSPPAFTDYLRQLAARHPHLRVILGAHNHIATHHHEEQLHLVTTTSFVESPFEFKLITVERGRLSMTTHSLFEHLAWKPRYDFNKTWTQGRPTDRCFDDVSPSIAQSS